MKQILTSAMSLMVMLIACVSTASKAAETGESLDPVSDQLRQQAAMIRDSAMAGGSTIDTIASLISEVGPRMAATPSDRLAADWAVRKMSALGLQNVRKEPVSVPHWDAGQTLVSLTGKFSQDLAATALGGSVGTDDDGIIAPVLMVRDLAQLQSIAEETVRGKIVFFNQRMTRTKNLDGYRKAVVIRRDGAVVAAERGAVAAIIRSVGTSSDRFAHTGATQYADDVRKIPAAAISNPDADTLAHLLSGNETVSVHLRMTARDLGRGFSSNVLGELPGRGPLADEIVLLVAHLDTWANTPGAQDNGAGIAVMLEIIRLLHANDRGPTPRRTVRVLLCANEEFGFGGIKAYIDRYKNDLGHHVLALEADGGAGRVWGLQSGVGDTAVPWVELVHSLMKPLDIEFLGNEGLGGPDIRRLGALGVPTMDLYQDMRSYFDIHHTKNDTLAKIDPEQLRQMLAAFAVVAHVGAYADIDFGRHPQRTTSD